MRQSVVVYNTLDRMISLRVGSHRFHYRAAAIVLNDGYVLLHRLQGDAFWALPGGRVEAGESASDAICREFVEELDQPIVCGSLACIGENFFEYENEPHHEIGLYFYASLPAHSPLLSRRVVHIGVEGGKRLEFQWFATAELSGIDMRPAHLKQAIASGVVPTHFLQRT